jgi:hypothetical protein
MEELSVEFRVDHGCMYHGELQVWVQKSADLQIELPDFNAADYLEGYGGFKGGSLS